MLFKNLLFAILLTIFQINISFHFVWTDGKMTKQQCYKMKGFDSGKWWPFVRHDTNHGQPLNSFILVFMKWKRNWTKWNDPSARYEMVSIWNGNIAKTISLFLQSNACNEGTYCFLNYFKLISNIKWNNMNDMRYACTTLKNIKMKIDFAS